MDEEDRLLGWIRFIMDDAREVAENAQNYALKIFAKDVVANCDAALMGLDPEDDDV